MSEKEGKVNEAENVDLQENHPPQLCINVKQIQYCVSLCSSDMKLPLEHCR